MSKLTKLIFRCLEDKREREIEDIMFLSSKVIFISRGGTVSTMRNLVNNVAIFSEVPIIPLDSH